MEQTKTVNRLATKFNIKTTLAGLALGYMILAFSLPIKRDFLVWQEVNNTTLACVFQLFFGFTMCASFILVLGNGYPKIARVFNLICSKKVIYPICLIALGLSLVLTALHIPGFWWTWTSFGVQVCTVLLAYLILENRTQPYEATIVGIGFSGAAIGIWEIPYQWGMGFIYYLDNTTREAFILHLKYQTKIELPLILGGILILIVLSRKYKLVSFNRWFWIFLVITIGLYTCWFLTGFQQEMVYDFKNLEWVQVPMNMTVKTIYRASKVTLALGLISLIWKERNEASRIQSKLL